MMEAVVLAGGRGTRLQSIVSDRPKPLAPISGNTTFLNILLDYLIQQEVDHIIISVGYKKEQIMSFFGSCYRGVPITYAIEEKPLNTGGAIKNSMKFIKRADPFFVLNGDTYCPVNFKYLLKKYKEVKASVLIPVKHMHETSRYGTIEFDRSGRIYKFIEKKEGSGFINVGCYVLEKTLCSEFLCDSFSFEKDYLEKEYMKKKFFAVDIEEFFIDIGVPEDYMLACSIFSNYVYKGILQH